MVGRYCRRAPSLRLRYLSDILKREDIHSRLIYGTDMPLIRTLLVSPFYFPGRLSLAEMIRLTRIDNDWDEDVRLKQALGVPTGVFRRSGELVGIHPDEDKSGQVDTTLPQND